MRQPYMLPQFAYWYHHYFNNQSNKRKNYNTIELCLYLYAHLTDIKLPHTKKGKVLKMQDTHDAYKDTRGQEDKFLDVGPDKQIRQ